MFCSATPPPATRRALPWQERARFYLRRPAQLWRNHAPTLWRLARGERRTRAAWQSQRRLQTWLQARDADSDVEGVEV